MLFLQALFQQNTFKKKGKDPESDPYPDTDPYLLLMDPDPRGPKTCGSCGSGSPTMICSTDSGAME